MDIRRKTGIEMETEFFYSGESLYNAIAKQGYIFDLILLDIELMMMNGVQVGQKIREELNNDIVQIVYISGKESYAMELFDIRPLNFLIKPVDRKKWKLRLKRSLKLQQKIMLFSNLRLAKCKEDYQLKI